MFTFSDDQIRVKLPWIQPDHVAFVRGPVQQRIEQVAGHEVW